LTPTQLFPAIASDLKSLDAVIREHLGSEVALINSISEYIITAGGKRLRPVLLILFAKAFGYQGNFHHLLAAVVEMIHTATLLHDDVVDESALRRGRSTANATFGNAASVLSGDFLYSRAFQMMVKTNNMRVMQILADATNVIAEGEVLQLLNVNDAAVSEQRYLQVIRYKTAKLFEASAQLGALLGGADECGLEQAALYGRSVGTAFQLVDDVLDYSGLTPEIGKNVGDDLREGKPTLPLIHLLQVGNDDERAMVRKAIESGSAEQFNKIMLAVQRTGSLDYTLTKAKEESQQAFDSLAGLPAGEFRNALEHLTVLAVNRHN
jgi:octaprenyl-diphosphate synthase